MLNLQVTYAVELVNIPINSQLCCVAMDTIWKNAGEGENIKMGVDVIKLAQDIDHWRA